MKCISSLTASSLLLALSRVHVAYAMKSYLKNLPNGNLFTQPLGHPDSDETKFTEFATAFSDADLTRTASFCKATFPGSDMTNGEAFGDPCCTWKKGETAPQTVTAFTTTPTKKTTCATAETPVPAATTVTPAAITATPAATAATPAATEAPGTEAPVIDAPQTEAPETDAPSASSLSDSSTSLTPAPATDSSTGSASASTTPAPVASSILKPSSSGSKYNPGQVSPGGGRKDKHSGGGSKGNKSGNGGSKGQKFRGYGSGKKSASAAGGCVGWKGHGCIVVWGKQRANRKKVRASNSGRQRSCLFAQKQLTPSPLVPLMHPEQTCSRPAPGPQNTIRG